MDDGSEPPAAEVFAPFEGNLTLRSIRLRQSGPARARNAALAVALGEYVVFTDDDCLPDPGWLEAFDAVFVARPDAGAGGHIVDAPENNIFGRSSQLLVRYLYQYGESSTALPRFFCGNNIAFPRLELAALQGFSEGYPSLPARIGICVIDGRSSATCCSHPRQLSRIIRISTSLDFCASMSAMAGVRSISGSSARSGETRGGV